MIVHFVGFRGEEYNNAVKIWGKPDFFHYVNDPRFRFGGEVDWENDIVIFAKGCESRNSSFSFNDSNQF